MYEDRFLKELYGLQGDPRKADLFIEGVERYLTYAPECGVQIYENSDVWFVSVTELADFPDLQVFYTFNEHTVYCLSIRLQGL